MQGKLRIALAQFDFPVGNIAGNEARIARMIAEARDVHGADVVLFPELAVSGYPPEDLLLRPSFLADCEAALQRIATAAHGIVAVVGWPQSAGAIVYNAASVLRDGEVAATYRKRELPNYAVFDERRYFDIDPDGGACVFEVNGVLVGLVICEDLWFAEPLADAARAGAQLVLVPNASPFDLGKHAQRDALLAMRVAETGVALAYVNVVGGQDALVFDGASVLADGDGCIHPAARAFEDHWCVADYDAATRKFIPVAWPADGDESRDALAWRAIVRGTRDYCAKNGFSKVWLGLSGGIDSSLVLAVAVDALGAENVTAVRLPSRYTAGLSNDLAAEQCAALGVKLEAISIEAPFKGFLEALAPWFEGRPVDTTEENLQSRSRGVLLMAMSNKFGGLLLTTGNKSEYAVGYATIYGDMCGGYAPIKDLYKTEVFALARWRNTVAGAPVIPPAVIDRPPTAELRENQKDQDSLPPYDVLDGILLRYVDQEQSRDEIVAAGFDPATVDKVLRLVRISEWKRHQAAPGPKVSRRAFGRERRYPITNKYSG
ncbi:NAD+ synthase [Pseudoxanthomonas helianthi]|uniref:Glutamine-dependent NAD(+) synthetase n=1 Tax=Pseudoxanthomonas helianthi TaxID=1453541 RepID=A0A940X249_9GAMM|nr:NAD+ synthase [Pseudoxanthomonas helianthi]MBP3984533.1 NAD+ synthase [Pseudoxanthomonas helianthi]